MAWQVTDVGVCAVLPSLPNLTDLNVTGTGITDAAILALRRHCLRLQSLHARGCDFGLPNGAHLNVSAFGKRNAETTAMTAYGVTEQAVKELASYLPNGK